MLGNLEYLNIPVDLIAIIIGFLVISNLIGEALKLKGILAPEFMRIRDHIKRKKQESEILKQMPKTLQEVQNSLKDFRSHYDVDNITKRDKWMENVNHKLEEHDNWREDFDKKLDTTNDKLDKNNKATISILIDNMRNTIINFASYVIDEKNPVTREQFNRVFRMYDDYEEIIEEEGLVNGEVDIAIRIIRESYEVHLKNHTFVEDVRGYFKEV